MDWHIPLIITGAIGWGITYCIAVGARIRANAFTSRAREYRAVISFARTQPMSSVGRRFLDAWQDGDLDQRDPELFQEWQAFRSDFLRNLRVWP